MNWQLTSLADQQEWLENDGMAFLFLSEITLILIVFTHLQLSIRYQGHNDQHANKSTLPQLMYSARSFTHLTY